MTQSTNLNPLNMDGSFCLTCCAVYSVLPGSPTNLLPPRSTSQASRRP